MAIRFPDVRDAVAALMVAAMADLAANDSGPVFREYAGRSGWRRSSQETLVLDRQELWEYPPGLFGDRWWDRLTEMEGFRNALASHPELSSRVDELIGFPFGLRRRQLISMLTVELLTPLVEGPRTYTFHRARFDAAYARVEAGLLAETVRLVQAVPLLGFDMAFQPDVRVPEELVIRLMTEAELTAAVQAGMPIQASTSTTGRTVSRLHQRAVIKVSDHPVQVGSPAGPVAGPVAVPASIEDDAHRLQIALRLVCGGSVTTGRPIQMQHPDDFDAHPGHSATLCNLDLPDENRVTILGTIEQVTQVQEIMTLLASHATAGDRPLQMALRRLVSAGSRGLAEDRLVDLIVAAEALFIHAAGRGRTGRKRDFLERGAATLLAGDAELSVSASAITAFIADAYKRRNHEVHADPHPPDTARLLDGTLALSLGAIVEDLERLMRRAVVLMIRQKVLAAQPLL
jgi:hypothetical protein